MIKFNTLCLGDYHLQDLTNTPLDKWKYEMFEHSFYKIRSIIIKNNINKVILTGDIWDYVPKGNSLELFAKFVNILKPFNLEIIMISGNHEVISGQGKTYYQDIMKDYFKINYNIKVYDWYEDNEVLYCSHKHIKRLERLNKNYRIVYTHFRSNIPPIQDEIDVSTLNKKVELVISSDIHHRNQKDNIQYTGSPIDTHFDSNNQLESHTPSVLLLNEETLETKWETTLSDKYRKIKKVYTSTEAFLADVDNLREEHKTKHNFFKVVIQDRSAKLNMIKANLYVDFCIISKSKIDLDVVTENKKITREIVKTLSAQDVSNSLKDFCVRNNKRKDCEMRLINMFHKYEVSLND